MAYRYDSDLEFLKQLSSNDLKDLFDALVYNEHGELRANTFLTSSTEYKRYGHDYAKYPMKIAEELQHYGGNSFMNFFRDEGVLYKEILCDVCDHLKVSYNEKSETSLIEKNMLSKLLKNGLEQMNESEIKELLHELGTPNIDKMIGENKQVLIASVLTQMGDSHSYSLAIAVADAMVKKTLGHGLSSVVGKVALKKTLGILAGPIGWVITGALVGINLAGPAYRVTVPACVLVATLRLKLKAEREAKLKAERAEQAKRLAKQKAEREANKKKMWYLVIVFCILIGLAVLAVFYMKGKHHSSNNPKSGVKELKNPGHKN